METNKFDLNQRSIDYQQINVLNNFSIQSISDISNKINNKNVHFNK